MADSGTGRYGSKYRLKTTLLRKYIVCLIMVIASTSKTIKLLPKLSQVLIQSESLDLCFAV